MEPINVGFILGFKERSLKKQKQGWLEAKINSVVKLVEAAGEAGWQQLSFEFTTYSGLNFILQTKQGWTNLDQSSVVERLLLSFERRSMLLDSFGSLGWS